MTVMGIDERIARIMSGELTSGGEYQPAEGDWPRQGVSGGPSGGAVEGGPTGRLTGSGASTLSGGNKYKYFYHEPEQRKEWERRAGYMGLASLSAEGGLRLSPQNPFLAEVIRAEQAPSGPISGMAPTGSLIMESPTSRATQGSGAFSEGEKETGIGEYLSNALAWEQARQKAQQVMGRGPQRFADIRPVGYGG
jgi:hypothetical protein